jgi:hypothetical protein
MIQRYTFITLFLFSFFFCNLGKAQEKYDSSLRDTVTFPSQKKKVQTDTIYLAMFLKTLNQESQQEESSMIIIGKYSNGVYIPLKYMTLSNIEESETYRILSDNRKFYVYKHGGKLASVDIKGVSYCYSACSSLFTGIPKQNPIYNKSLYSQIQGYTQYSKEGEQNQIFLALSKNLAKSNVLNRLPYKPSEQHMEVIEATIKENLNLTVAETESENGSVNLDCPVDTSNIQFYNCVITTSKKPYLITSFHHDSDWCLSSAIVFEQNGNELSSVLELFDVNSLDSGGSGYSLFDVLDIDGDGVNEIIFEIVRYENTDIAIYKLVNGKFELVMTVSVWGC